MEDLVSYIDEHKQPGEKLNLTVIRNQTYLDLNVLLGDRSNSTKSDNSTKSEDAKDPYS
jgi:S1-C subfamily serine protease